LNFINYFLVNRSYIRLIVATFAILTIGSIIYHHLEGWSWIDSTYFSVITLTTVGYGDFSPQTDLGKIFTIFYVLTGIGIIFGFISAFYQHRLEANERFLNRKKDKRGDPK
jgi:voltage-gated potassium channel